MEIFKGVMTDYILFSLIESYIVCLFFRVVGKCNNFKIFDIMLIGVCNSIISTIFPPLMSQPISIFFMGIMINIKEKRGIVNSILLSVSALTYFMVLEIVYSFVISIGLKIDTFDYNEIELFLLIIPIRVVEIYLLKRGDLVMKKLKFWIGEVEKPEKEEVKTETK